MSLYELTQNTGETGNNKIYGVVIGIVTNNNDPDKLGRLKLKFPWRGSNDESEWARIAMPMAGNDRGTYFIPEVDDEVLVVFENGDIIYPYIIGTLWNGNEKPPDDNADGKNNIRKIKSRSGHEIIFDDNSEQKKEKMEIHTNAGHKIVMDDSSGQEKIEIIDKTGSNKITFDSAQNAIAIESSMKLSIKSQMIEIESGGTMSIKSSGPLTLQGAIIKIN